jgi:alpha-galactosidase
LKTRFSNASFVPKLKKGMIITMGIIFDKEKNVFHLQAGNMSYVFEIYKGKYLVHLYWGRKVSSNNLGYLLKTCDRAFSANPDSADRSFSLDTIPLEYPAYGNTDFRCPAFCVQQENGSTISDLTYQSHTIYSGKPKLNGLPSTYSENDNEAKTLELIMKDQLTGLKVILSYTVFEHFDAMTRSVRFLNEGNEELTLLKALSMSVDFSHADFDMLQLSGAWARERHIHRRKLIPGMQSIESRRGASSHQQNPFIALLERDTNEDSGAAYGFSFVYSGNFVAGVEVDQFDSGRVFIGINPFDFTWLLEPGESFQTPETVLVFSNNGIGGMSRTYHKLFQKRLCRGEYRDKTRPILVNNWEATYFNFNSDKIEAIARVGRELGIELMVLDDGWFGKRNDDTTSLGDWFVDKNKLPLGLEDLAQRIHRLEMKFGLWLEPEMISTDSDLYRTHPDWCLQVPDRSCSQGRNQLVLDFSRNDVCDCIIQIITDILSHTHIDYVKWDCNRNLTEIGSAQLPAKRQRETAHRHILGVYRVIDEITSKFPHILFESCSGGGGRFDPGMLCYMPQTWTSDDTDAVERLKIQYGTSVVYPVCTMGAHVSAVPNHVTQRVTNLKMRGDVAFAGNFGYELDLTKFTTEEMEMARHQITLYKELRELVQYGDMYRLKSPFEGNEIAWIYVSEDKNEAFVEYFRVLDVPNAPLRRIQLQGLDPEKLYDIVEENISLNGDILMYAGLNIPELHGDYQSNIWRLRAANSRLK